MPTASGDTPVSRPTHSKLSLMDIKNLIESSKTELMDSFVTKFEGISNTNKCEILNIIKEETKSIQNIIQSLATRIEDIECSLESALKRVNNVEKKIGKQQDAQEQNFEDLCYEAELRYHKRKSLIISGLPELKSGSLSERREADVEAMQNLTACLDLHDFNPKEMVRVGRIDATKPRLLRVKCRSIEEKSIVLQRSKKLKDNP